MRRKQKKNLITYLTLFFCNRLQGGRFQVTMLLSWLVCIVVILRGIKMAWEEKSIFKQKKNVLHFLIHLPLISTKEIFAHGAEGADVDFSSKWETPIICHKEAPEKAIKNSDIFFILFSNFEEEIIISERDSMTRINKLFSNLKQNQSSLLVWKNNWIFFFLFKSCFWRKKWLFIPTDK